MTNQKTNLNEIAKKIIDARAIEIKNVDSGEKPFVYTTGNRGPGYVNIKDLVGQPKTLKFLTKKLAHKIVDKTEFDFIQGNATGGMIPAWQLRNDISEILGKEIPFCYLRTSRKNAYGELITGNKNNLLIKPGMKVLVFEELVNYAHTTENAVTTFRNEGYQISHASCILTYDHSETNQKLKNNNLSLVPLITLPQLLTIAETEEYIPREIVQSYKNFLIDPIEWQLQREFAIPKSSAEKAIAKGHKLIELTPSEAIKHGAPKDKVNSGIVYYAPF